MATMFPSEVSAFTTVGEQTVYEFLQRIARPDNTFLVWYSPDIEGREPDFILLSPDCGLIVLEVKDWVVNQIIEITPKDVLLQIGGRQERRKQPLAQAREYVNGLMSMLGRGQNAYDGNHSLPCPVTWGAVFPHISREDFNACRMNEVMDGSRVLCWDDLQGDSRLNRDVSGETFRKWLIEHFPPLFPFSLTPKDVHNLRGCIFPIVRLDLPQRSGVTSPQANTVFALDQEQENLARTFGPGKTLITGPSGSGKTLILAHQAWHLPRVDKRVKRILVTCFNLSLVGYIRRLLARKGVSLGINGVEVLPFYSLCERILEEPLAHTETSDFYTVVVQETLARLDGSHVLQGHWDAILVDEGQDFSADMVEVISRLLPEHATLMVAEDENQRLYKNSGAAWGEIVGMKNKRLFRQYRNTKQIAQMAIQALGVSDEIVFAGSDGQEPTILRYENGSELVLKVADAIAELVRQGVPMSEIAILYVHSTIPGVTSLPKALVEALEACGVLARWAARDTESKRNYDITTDSVTISTIYSAKGLDFAHVFLLGTDVLDMQNENNSRFIYVGMTRARECLTLSICEKRYMKN